MLIHYDQVGTWEIIDGLKDEEIKYYTKHKHSTRNKQETIFYFAWLRLKHLMLEKNALEIEIEALRKYGDPAGIELADKEMNENRDYKYPYQANVRENRNKK